MPTDQKRRGLRRLDRGQTGVPLSPLALVVTDRKLLDDLNGLVEPEARGDPMSPLRWTAKGYRLSAFEDTFARYLPPESVTA